jgi:hypothetical protein
MTPREVEEYRALRATIRERGTTRVWIALAGISAWAALTVATAAIAALPVATLLPLLVLATTFEIVLALHVGVERIGRYLQVFYEETPGWETRIVRFGEAFHPRGSDPLLAVYFGLATLLNLVALALVEPLPIEWSVIGGCHVLVLGRLLFARQRAAATRGLDLERFRQLKASG